MLGQELCQIIKKAFNTLEHDNMVKMFACCFKEKMS